MVVYMGRKRGKIEEWLRRIVFGKRGSEYIVFIKHRYDNREELRAIPGELIEDIRGGCLYIGEEVIPYHRVVEIRSKKGTVVYKRAS